MASWAGWVAAVGGLLTVLGVLVNLGTWAYWIGGLLALIFGIWGAVDKK